MEISVYATLSTLKETWDINVIIMRYSTFQMPEKRGCDWHNDTCEHDGSPQSYSSHTESHIYQILENVLCWGGSYYIFSL